MKTKLNLFISMVLLPIAAYSQGFCDNCLEIKVFLEDRNTVASHFDIAIFTLDGYPLEKKPTRTDDNGVYLYVNSYGKLKVGEEIKVNIWKQKSGYEFFEGKHTISVNNNNPVFILKKEPFILISGHVKDKNTDDLLNKVRISVASKSYHSDSSGFFRLPIPLKELAGDLKITFQKEGYSDSIFSHKVGIHEEIVDINMSMVKKEISQPVEAGFVFDERDKARYRVESINKYVFFMENNQFSTPFSEWPRRDPSLSSFGRLYTWQDAQTVCPPGWRIPSKLEIQHTIDLLGERQAKIILFESSNLLAGKRDSTGRHIYFSKHAYCWLSSSKDEKTAFYFGTDIYGRVGIFSADKSEALSCRCIKDK